MYESFGNECNTTKTTTTTMLKLDRKVTSELMLILTTNATSPQAAAGTKLMLTHMPLLDSLAAHRYPCFFFVPGLHH